MSSKLSRAGTASFQPTETSKKKVSVGKKNYLKDDEDEDEDINSDNGDEGYSIDPSVQLWKSIDFTRNINNGGGNNSSKSNVLANNNNNNNNSFAKNGNIYPDKKEPVFKVQSSHETPQKSLINPALAPTPPAIMSSKGVETAPTINTATSVQISQHIKELKLALLSTEGLKIEAEKKRELAEKEGSNLQNELEKQKAEMALMMEIIKREREEMKLKAEILEFEKQQQALEAQKKSEKEREDLLASLEVMKAQNSMLANRIEKGRLDAQLQLEEERIKANNALRLAQNENKDITHRLLQSQLEAERRLQIEKEELRAKLIRMESEKIELLNKVRDTEEKAKERIGSGEIVVSQLATEKIELSKMLERMEIEKKDMAMKLSITEQMASAQARVVEDQIIKEKLEVHEAKEKMISLEKSLAQTIAENDSKLKLEKDQSSTLAKQLSLEREALSKQIELINKEKIEIQEKAIATENAILQRERLEKERIEKERDELKLSLARMKEDLLNDKIKNIDQQKSANNLTGTKSLYDLLETNTTGSGKLQLTAAQKEKSMINDFERKLSKMNVMKMSIIPENEEIVDSFMDLDDDSTVNADVEDEVDPFEDLPAPHAAAASGDFKRLQMLGGLEKSLLSALDTANRSPLFYAVAYGQIEIIKFLLESCPELAAAVDKHGDTPLHAAASAGSAECVELIIKATDGKADTVNHMNMSPAHLSGSVDCLEVLYKYGANMAAVDENGRSPLFVACAMNRSDVAEYLINCLDETETSLLTKDTRGDTPLHAAACNGSVDTLLLLLQYGIDPLITNDKGLKAIDLAIRNKQRKCQEMLAEYHLHFSTSSEFDSVLFLATLEGHKLVKEGLMSPNKEKETYDIIKKNMSDTINPTDKGNLSRAKSLFSLKNNNKSLRLQKWGSWIAYEDQLHCKTYWYNHKTSEGQWDKPSEVIKLQEMAAMNASQQLKDGMMNGGKELLGKKLSMRLKRVGEWIQYVTESGQTFYYNDKNGEFQWINPHTEMQERENTLKNSEELRKGNSKDRNTMTHDEVDNDDYKRNSFNRNDSDLYKTGNWRPYQDPETSTIFWYNSETKVSQWECPLESIPLSLRNKEDKIDDDDDNEALTVNGLDDLGI